MKRLYGDIITKSEKTTTTTTKKKTQTKKKKKNKKKTPQPTQGVWEVFHPKIEKIVDRPSHQS